MKIRTNRRRVLTRIKANNQYRWIVMPMIKAAEEKRIIRERIHAITMVDEIDEWVHLNLGEQQ